MGPVLVVEDDPNIRQAMTELLEDDGYECVLANMGSKPSRRCGTRLRRSCSSTF
jgi:CheY-like chemotaxis protein